MSDSRITELELAIKNLNWDIVGLSEVRRDREAIEEYSEFILYHTSACKGRNGVGFWIKRSLKNYILSFKSFSDRVASLEIQATENQILSIIQVYAPTENCEKEEIERFYTSVESALDFVNSKNLIILGDFNAQIGKIQKGEERILGRYSYGKRSARGQKLVEFALEHNLRIVNSIYKRKACKKWTWRSPNGKHFNEIDYILTNRSNQVQNFDIINNLNFNTDHRMIRSKIKIKLKRSRRFIKPVSYTTNLPKLSEECEKYWEDRLIESLKVTDNVQNQYTSMMGTMKLLLRQLPEQEQGKNKYFNQDTMNLLQERKLLYTEKRTKEIKCKITQLSKQINKSILHEKKKQRQKMFEKFISKTGAIRKAYKELSNKLEWTANLKNKNGNMLSKRPDILNDATSFYKKLYKANQSNISETLYPFPYDQEPLDIPPITRSEIENAIRSQKNGKTPGNDQITNELLKSFLNALQEPLQNLFNQILYAELTPEQWSESIIILLHKKGDRSELGNYRPISLMSNIYKIFAKVLLNRLSKTLDEQQPREQAGFRKHFSTIDHIQVVSQLIERANEYDIKLYMCFIDYTKAFDSIHQHTIWPSLFEQGVHPKYINLIKSVYSKCRARVRLEKEGAEFPVSRGLRQGDPTSPKIFTAVLEAIFRNLDWEKKGLKIDGEHLSHLRFADDIVVFAENASDLGKMVDELAKESKKAGLSLNITKTKIMTNSDKIDIRIGTDNIEYVTDYVYLGQSVSFQNCTEKEIQRRIAIAWKKYWSFKEVMKSKEISIKIKNKLYEVAIMPCLTYGCQTWALRKEEEEKLAICQRKMERSMLGLRIKDRVSNKKIRKTTKLTDIRKRVRKLKWNWAGHVCRLDKTRWTKKVTEWIPRDRKRKRGRQRKRWRDIFSERCGLDWMRQARDRNLWRDLGEAYAVEATFT